mmetsp:Transcript_56420/g.181151  ORF Transcript_56420/g.181151 Transcript_56420/m.181151 type:complete len:255 (+) Transcript_56420:247-1011(+)
MGASPVRKVQRRRWTGARASATSPPTVSGASGGATPGARTPAAVGASGAASADWSSKRPRSSRTWACFTRPGQGLAVRAASQPRGSCRRACAWRSCSPSLAATSAAWPSSQAPALGGDGASVHGQRPLRAAQRPAAGGAAGAAAGSGAVAAVSWLASFTAPRLPPGGTSPCCRRPPHLSLRHDPVTLALPAPCPVHCSSCYTRLLGRARKSGRGPSSCNAKDASTSRSLPGMHERAPQTVQGSLRSCFERSQPK